MTQQDKDDKNPSDPQNQDSPQNEGGPGTERGPEDQQGQGGPDDTSSVAGDAPQAADTGEPQEATDPANNRALAVIQRFGGIRPMATKLGVAVSTVQGWKNRGAIPESRHDEILAAARSNNIDLDRAVLSASGEESVGTGQAADSPSGSASSPWGRPGDTEETLDAEEVASDQASGPGTADDVPEDAEVSDSDAHAAGAESEAASMAGPEVAGASAAAQQPPGGPRGWLPGMFLGAAIVVVGAGVAIYARDVWQPYLAGADQQRVQPASQQALSELETTVSDLSSQLAGVQDRLDGVGQNAQQAQEAAQQAADTAERAAQTAQQAQDTAQQAQQAADQAPTRAPAGDGEGAGGQQVAQLRQQVDQLSGRLDQATNRLETLAGRVDAGASSDEGGGGASAQRLDTLASRIDELSNRVEQLSQTAASREAAQSLADRLSAVEQQTQELAERQQSAGDAAAGSARPAAQALAVAELRDALRFSAPFADQLEAARQVVADEGALSGMLDELQPMAAQGVPTRAELASAFDRAAGEAVAVDMGASQDGMLGGVLRRLNDVVTVRRVDASAEGNSVDARLARAQNKLAAGDLRQAVGIVEQLPQPAKGEMEGWLSQARSRLAAEQALSQLSSQLMRAIASPAGEGGAEGSGQNGSAN